MGAAGWGIEHAGERNYLRDVALRPGGGGLRTLSNTLEYATVLSQDDTEGRCLTHIKDAFAQLTSRPGAAA